MSVNPTRPESRQAQPDAKRQPKHLREPTDIHAFLRRMIAAQGRRVADADPVDLADLHSLHAVLDEAEEIAVAGMRRRGVSWTDIGDAVGMRKQSAHQRWGHLSPKEDIAQ